MIIIDIQTPLNIFDLDIVYYCPNLNTLTPHGMVICRLSELEFLCGILSFCPTLKPSTNDSLFLSQIPGLIWTCPDSLKKKLLSQELCIHDVIKHWHLTDESIGLINTAFAPAPLSLLQKQFTREDIIIKTLNSNFLAESITLKNIAIRESAFFKDQYNGQWIVSRNNISALCLIKVFYDPINANLKLLSDAYMINELVLVFVGDSFANIGLTR